MNQQRRAGRTSVEKPRNLRRAVARLLAYFGAEWISLLIASGTIIGSAVLKALGPARLGAAIQNHIERSPDSGAFVEQMLGVLVIYAGVWVADAVSRSLMAYAGNRLIYRLRRDTFAHLQRLSMSYFERRGIGDIISRVTNDVELIYTALINGFANLIDGAFSIVGVLIAMLALDLRLSAVVIGVMPIMAVVTAIIGRAVRQAFRANQAAVGALNARIEEDISAVRLITAFRKESDRQKEFRRVSARAREAGMRAETLSFILHPVMRFINGLALALVVGVGGALAVSGGAVGAGTYSIGLITAFVLYARRFFEPLRHMTEFYNIIQSALAGAERVFEILDAVPEITDSPDAAAIQEISGDVEFRNVSFGYLPEQTVVEDVSLYARSGRMVAIVGPTGAGKTTLVNLLSRFYDVRSGSILIDGRDIRGLQVDSLRTRMGVVLQEPYFFADTIEANIRYGNPRASWAQVEEAARLSRADEFIRHLPAGYQTVLAERGESLAQGQRQLLAIARAILADPRILVLDEATSSVDSLTEHLIQQGLLHLMQGRTSFIIAHRLSTIRNADQVVVLHNHRVVEQGTHTELIAADGFYARLYRMQFERPEITEENV